MATKDDLDAAIGTLEQKTQNVQTQLNTLRGVVADLQAKLANVPGAPDFQPEIDRINAVDAALDAASATPTPPAAP